MSIVYISYILYYILYKLNYNFTNPNNRTELSFILIIYTAVFKVGFDFKFVLEKISINSLTFLFYVNAICLYMFANFIFLGQSL